MARRAWGSAMAFSLLIAACGGRLADNPPDGSAVSGGGTGAVAGSGGLGGTVEEPWDAMVDGAVATPEQLEQLCTMQGTPVESPCTQDELSYRLSRRWWQCSGEFVYNTPDAVGVEFTTDGHWYLLRLDPGGAVVRGTGASYEGTWDMYGPGSPNGPCSIGVNIYKGGMLGSFPIFEKQPTKVNLNTGGDGGKPVYAAIP
jgi:hypothetical protein